MICKSFSEMEMNMFERDMTANILDMLQLKLPKSPLEENLIQRNQYMAKELWTYHLIFLALLEAVQVKDYFIIWTAF